MEKPIVHPLGKEEVRAGRCISKKEIIMRKQKRNEKLKKNLSLAEIGTEARHRSRIFFSQHKTVSHVFVSKKHKPAKHRQREELNWSDE